MITGLTANSTSLTTDIDSIYQRISGYLQVAKSNILQSINQEMVKAYWMIGYEIIENEQLGASRATYGEQLLSKLSEKLIAEFGKGYSVSNLRNMRKFYQVYQDDIHQTASGEFEPKLSWSKYCLLMQINSKSVRQFYEMGAIKNNWSVRELSRQIGSLLYDRLAKSKDKAGLIQLAIKGQEIEKPADAIKDPLILEFLNIHQWHQLTENKLEEALINNLQHFLLELGKGVRHEVVSQSCFRISRKPSMSLDEPRDMNKELSRQCDKVLEIAWGRNRERLSPPDNHNLVSC